MEQNTTATNGTGLLNEDQARVVLGGVCKKTMYNLRKRQGLKYVPVGTRVMYDPSDLDRWIESQKRREALSQAAA